MSDFQDNQHLYVAPAEAPPSRRPPPGTVGAIGWLRKNLFKGWFNSLITVLTFAFVIWFLTVFFTWIVRDAQWGVVINNVKLFNVGFQYRAEDIWRIELIAIVLIFLSGLGVALWGGMTRAFMLTIVVVMFVMILIPIAASKVTPAPIRYFVSAEDNYSPLRFPADADQEMSFTFEPINRQSYASEDGRYTGFMESASGASNSRIKWNEIQSKANLDADDPNYIDLSQYDLVIKIQVTNGSAQNTILAEAISTPGNPEVTLNFTAPATGWYIVRTSLVDGVELDGLGLPGSSAGYGFLRVNDVGIYRTRTSEIEKLTEKYGAIPEIDACHSNDEFACQVAERVLRFDGSRNFGEFLRLQLSPYLTQVSIPLIIGMLAFFLSYALGHLATHTTDKEARKWTSRLTTLGWVLLMPFSWFILTGVEGAEDVHPLFELEKISLGDMQGLTLTLFLTFVSVTLSLPLGVVFALGRRSGLPVIGTFSVLFIELVRGAPLITILFFARYIVPFFFSAQADIENVIRMLIGLTLFSAAYQAEIVRGGLQIIPGGQTEAAQALGLNPFYTNVFIILPQALRAVIPATMSQFVSLFKDTSLVSIIGLFELLGIVELIVNGQQQYRPFVREAYLYIGIIYFVIAFMMSAVSRRLEESGSGAARRR